MVDTKWLDELERKFPCEFFWGAIPTVTAKRLIQIARESAEKDVKIARLERIEKAATALHEELCDLDAHGYWILDEKGEVRSVPSLALEAYRKATAEEKA